MGRGRPKKISDPPPPGVVDISADVSNAPVRSPICLGDFIPTDTFLPNTASVGPQLNAGVIDCINLGNIADKPSELLNPNSPNFPARVDNSIEHINVSTTTEDGAAQGVTKEGFGGKTFASTLKKAHKGLQLSYIKPDESQVIMDEDIASEVDYWKFTLVGCVMGKQTNLAEIGRLIAKHWTHVTSPQVLYFSKGWYYFRFTCEADMNLILSDSWNINGYPLVFKQWSPTIVDELDKVTVVPVWVLLPNLDPCFWSAIVLSKVVSHVGKPICADEYTSQKSKLAFARVLVEVDVSQPLPTVISFQSSSRGVITQKVEYEWVPFYCHACHKIGHTSEKCRRNSQPKKAYVPKKADLPTVDGHSVEHVSTLIDSGPKTSCAVPTQSTTAAGSILPVGATLPVEAAGATPPSQHLEGDGFSVVSYKKKSSSRAGLVTTNLDARFRSLETETHDAVCRQSDGLGDLGLFAPLLVDPGEGTGPPFDQ